MKKTPWIKPRIFRLFLSITDGKPANVSTAEFVSATNQLGSTIAGSTCTLINGFYSPASGAPLDSRCITSNVVKSTGGNSAHIVVVNTARTGVGPS
ncbi:MAG: hypothetical protein GY696_10665 [Gammaproteobacteria bacterium]|nr:hypothetical protein [Gammaproteobacteria bacterium]